MDLPRLPAPAQAAARPCQRDPSPGRRVSPAPAAERKDYGLSITVGYVYRGKALPDLVGVYVYGDCETGRIWNLRAPGGKIVASGELIDATKHPLHIASFGADPQGELFILAFDGQIHKLVAASR